MGILADALGALGKAGNVLDLPASSVRDMMVLENPFDQWATPTQSKNRNYGRDVLQKWGVLGENQPGLDFGDVAGFGLDLVADPLNLGLAGRAGMTARAGARARKANAPIQAANDMSMSMRNAGALPEELLPQAQKVYRAAPMGPRGDEISGLADVPGTRIPELAGGHEVSRSGPGFYQRGGANDGGFEMGLDDAWESLDAAGPRYVNYPELRTLPDETLEQFMGSAERSLPLPPAGERAAREIMEISHSLKNHHANIIGEQGLKSLQDTIFDLDDDLYRQVEGDLAGQYFHGTNPGELPSVENAMEAIWKDKNHPLHAMVRQGDELRTIGDQLSRELQNMIRPAPAASQSFYQTPAFAGMEDLYLPYIAPELQQLMNVPRVRQGRLAAALGGHNALARGNSYSL